MPGRRILPLCLSPTETKPPNRRSNRCTRWRRPKASAGAARSIATPRRPCRAKDRAALNSCSSEQPGDKEDLAGKPFVGPAGRILDAALKDAGIPREKTFVTNAVKHFKHEMRGKRRLHKRPNNYEIERCRIWLDRERELVKPSTIIALGVTAARSLTGKTVTIAKMRKTPTDMADGTTLVVTVHPSALLRIEDENTRRAAYAEFVADLKAAAQAAKATAKTAAAKRDS